MYPDAPDQLLRADYRHLLEQTRTKPGISPMYEELFCFLDFLGAIYAPRRRGHDPPKNLPSGKHCFVRNKRVVAC